MDFNWVTAEERESLYNEVWAEPVTTVAKRYSLSDNGLRKHLKKMGIPLPPSGYWARIAAGQKVSKPVLPGVIGEVKRYVREYVIKYKPGIDQLADHELLRDEEFCLLREETKSHIQEICAQIKVSSQLRNPHRLIIDHKDEVVYRKKRDKALKQAGFNSNYYASVKSKYRDNEPILPIVVSESNTNRAYRILNTIINTIADMEGHTRVGIESGKDIGRFVVMHASFTFELREENKKRASSKDDDQHINMILSLSPKSWFKNNSYEKMEYRDHADSALEDQLGKVIFDMFVVANRLQVLDILEDREEERKWEEHKRKQRLEQMRKGELQEIKLLEEAASDWNKAEKIRRFADAMEQKIIEVNDENKKEKLIRWLTWARDKADWIDPLTEKEDELLGRSKHLFESIEKYDF